ncbi:MAG: hypothetical protein JWO06_2017 [Bacteroidota bacterium]|nr:hypothetical protein [Bacteroidota bacterium]
MRTIKILLLLCFASPAFAQDTTYFNDYSLLSRCLNSDRSVMLDTGSTVFKTAQQNVLKYCNDKYNFRVDTCATFYSCRNYFSVNTSVYSQQQQRYCDEHLKYQFFITIKIKPGFYYDLSFILDSTLQVKDGPDVCPRAGAKKIWAIKEWSAIVEQVKKYRDGFINPIDRGGVDLVWNYKKRKFVYEVRQGVNLSKPSGHTVAGYSGFYKANKLIVDAKTGKVLKAFTQQNCILIDPAF